MSSLEELLHTVNNYHERHGVTILFNERKPLWTRLKRLWLKVSTILFTVLLFLSSFETFSNNNKAFRLFNLLCVVALFEIFLTEGLIWIRRNKILELVDWCRKVEVQRIRTFHRPDDWFSRRRNKALFLIRLIGNGFECIAVFVIFIVPIINLFCFDGYQLIVRLDFKNFSERNSLPIFVLEVIALTPAIWFIICFLYSNLLFYILLSKYVVGQLELIAHYIEQLDLNNSRKLRFQLREIVKLHLDALKTIKKLSQIFTIALKSKELALYWYVSILVFGKELMALTVPPAMVGVILIVGFYCHACENMMEAEENIRNAYYELDWYKAPIGSKKLLLTAMQEPEQIRFGKVFHSDHVSMERFLLLVQRAYDFGIALLKLAKQ